MFGKKNRDGFKLNINKEEAEKEYQEYLNQPPEVLENLRKCKLYMVVFIPLGAIISLCVLKFFFDFKSFAGSLVTLGICILAGIINFLVSKKFVSNWKLRLVPLICLCVGWLIGIFCIQKIILIFLNVVG